MTEGIEPPWKADPFEIFLARLFGQKFLAHDEGFYMVGYRFRGKTIITETFHLNNIKEKPHDRVPEHRPPHSGR